MVCVGQPKTGGLVVEDVDIDWNWLVNDGLRKVGSWCALFGNWTPIFDGERVITGAFMWALARLMCWSVGDGADPECIIRWWFSRLSCPWPRTFSAGIGTPIFEILYPLLMVEGALGGEEVPLMAYRTRKNMWFSRHRSHREVCTSIDKLTASGDVAPVAVGGKRLDWQGSDDGFFFCEC